ncbi:hypothetical protein SPRG_21087 [Saprolegnia parasitica CBS 223.65]|uniref:C2H2-type domain-containing protein n=1 Tax=Saprolegnia parasitica (strain CBS 223.65) TaxID=695850 RepID=A0A067BVJ1_SAPPC|nr:hypothetical protein SPRG_21087 [Saprolegnia parasitica CBS 223.65]KDO22273.1 hypothetical protein SPRG_21087 [Saprolegnia parasitica CBS 223.65]|eukprot:XP_012207040.1 hypothetical protein SPRG_21087 [Saprolegnia parasitica CBS 223.65]
MSLSPPSSPEDRRFVCPIDGCNKRFKRKFTLQEHEKTHTGRFCTREKLVRHLKTHVGLRPFECSVCNKAFTTSGNLARHAKSHPELGYGDSQHEALLWELPALLVPTKKRRVAEELALPLAAKPPLPHSTAEIAMALSDEPELFEWPTFFQPYDAVPAPAMVWPQYAAHALSFYTEPLPTTVYCAQDYLYGI